MGQLSLDDVFPGGAILRRNFGKRVFSLSMWHHGFNDGKVVELFRGSSEEALDLAFSSWASRLESGNLPAQIKDTKGRILERKWSQLSFFEEEDDDDDSILQ